MPNPVGWVILARKPLVREIIVIGAIDSDFAADEEKAIGIYKPNIHEDFSTWKFSAFGLNHSSAETRRSLEAALQQLGLFNCNLQEIYWDIAGSVIQSILEVSH